MKSYRVTCPCCKGEKKLVVHDADDQSKIESEHMCTHCQGTGVIMAELPETVDWSVFDKDDTKQNL